MSGRAIVVTSGKGGVGKTTATANLGLGLAKHERKVVLVDGDIGLRNLDIIMGLENRIVYHLVDVVRGRCQVRQALVKDKRFPHLALLPASQVDQKEAISPEQMRELVAQLKEECDFVLIDCPAGIEQGFRNAVAGADEAIVITTPDVSPVRDADRVIGLLQHSMGDPQLIINRMSTQMVQRGDMLGQQDVLDILAVNLLGIVPEDEEVVVAGNRGAPVVLNERSRSGQAYTRIVRRILGEDVPIPELNGHGGLFHRLGKLFSRR
ncbi:MAG TPA: septum site-determining protein MinD [Candidatus Binatia bacterium]|jgi:septum site-determining protein MinD|nr:septum site-determining protein MinD [Candidatus Binatia bacterium]